MRIIKYGPADSLNEEVDSRTLLRAQNQTQIIHILCQTTLTQDNGFIKHFAEHLQIQEYNSLFLLCDKLDKLIQLTAAV